MHRGPGRRIGSPRTSHSPSRVAQPMARRSRRLYIVFATVAAPSRPAWGLRMTLIGMDFSRGSIGPLLENAVMNDGLSIRDRFFGAMPPPMYRPRVATVRVLHETGGRRQVVSHFNKATKGRIVRALLESGVNPRRPAALADVLRDLGWKVEEAPPGRAGAQLDVVVDEL